MATEAQQYLIQFLATLKGQKAVVKGLRQMEGAIKKTGQQMGVADKKGQSYAQGFVKIAKRALLTIPVWLLLRSTFMLLLRTIGEIIRTNVELQDKFARIRTVVSASSSSIERDMIVIKRAILDASVTTRRPILELADAFYFLRTANLSTQQAIDAFIPTINLMVGTLGNAQETARAVAGIYNTMNERLGENLSTAEAFTKISDALAFTYATQDVQMGELIQSYSKLAPFVTGLEEDFTELITILGFLNTRMLRGGRTGRLLGRTILQITKNSHKLAEIFDIALDPDKPISLVKVLTGLNNIIQTGTKLTKAQQKALQEVFATRGAVAPKLLLPDLSELIDQIAFAEENMEGFAERMRDIMEATVPAQITRMKNIFAVLFDEFASGVSQSFDLVEGLTKLNDSMAGSRKEARALGDMLAFLGETFEKVGRAQLALQVGEFGEARNQIQSLRTVAQFMQDQIDHEAELSETRAKEAKIRAQVEKNEKLTIRNAKLEKQELTHQLAIMKAQGASQSDLAKFKLDYLEHLIGQSQEEAHILELQKAQDKFQETILAERVKLLGLFSKAETDLLKIKGASELQILKVQERQLIARQAEISSNEFLLRLTKLRLRQQLAIEKAKERELNLATDLAIEFEKAGILEQGRIRRLIDLVQLPKSDLVKQFEESASDRQIILQNISKFTQEQQREIAEFINKTRELGLDGFNIPEPRKIAIKDFIDVNELLPTERIGQFWRLWQEQGVTATDIIMNRLIARTKEAFQFEELKEETAKRDLSGEANRFLEIMERQSRISQRREFGENIIRGREQFSQLTPQRIIQQIQPASQAFRPIPPLSLTFGEMNIRIAQDTLDMIEEQIVDKFKQQLRASDTLKKWLASIIRPEI